METTFTITPFNIGLPIGTILPVILSEKEIPIGWLLCDGRLIPEEYVDLIKKIGRYTPNLVGRTLIGSGAKPAEENSNGSKANFSTSAKFPTSTYGGEYRTVLTVNQLPRHNHNNWTKLLPVPFDKSTGVNFHVENARSGDGTMTGKDEPHNNMPPYFSVNYIIYTGVNNIGDENEHDKE